MSERSDTNVVPFKPKAQAIVKLQNRESVACGNKSDLPEHIEPLYALIHAAAGELKTDDSFVEAVINTLFNIDHISKLPSQDFKAAVKFLVRLHGNAPNMSVYKE